MNRPTPKHTAPELRISLLDGNQWDLKTEKPESFTLIVFYRGLHCPLCEKYLQQLQELLPDFEKRGVTVVAISMDTDKRTRLSRQKWGIDYLKLGYGLTEVSAREWGLYLSAGIKKGEPELFSEPGLFLVDRNNEIYYSSMNSNPWGRPYLPSFIKAVDYIVSSGYPARGEIL